MEKQYVITDKELKELIEVNNKIQNLSGNVIWDEFYMHENLYTINKKSIITEVILNDIQKRSN